MEKKDCRRTSLSVALLHAWKYGNGKFGQLQASSHCNHGNTCQESIFIEHLRTVCPHILTSPENQYLRSNTLACILHIKIILKTLFTLEFALKTCGLIILGYKPNHQITCPNQIIK